MYAGQEAAVRTAHGTLTGSKLRKDYDKAVYCHLLINLYAEYIMQNTGLDESHGGIEVVGKISTASDMQMIPL